MNIAILSPVFWTFDGISRVVEAQAGALRQQNNTVTIFALAANMPPPANVTLYLLGMPQGALAQRAYRLLFPFDFAKAMRWVPKLKGFDVIYSHQYPMNYLAYLAKRFYGAKYVFYNYGIAPPETFSGFMERIYVRIITLLANWTIKRADSAISISRYLQQQLKRETGLNSEVMYPRIDTNRFHEMIDGSRMREKHKLWNAPVVLFVGRISPHKGVHLLIHAFNLVKQQVPNTKLVIVGRHTFAGYSKNLEQMSDESVIFTGDVSDEDLPYYYAACDVYATATLWEGFDLPLAEAHACGKPVAAFNIGPHPEVVEDGEAGLLVPARDIGALARGIIRLLMIMRG